MITEVDGTFIHSQSIVCKSKKEANKTVKNLASKTKQDKKGYLSFKIMDKSGKFYKQAYIELHQSKSKKEAKAK